jgi:hypothetical protein
MAFNIRMGVPEMEAFWSDLSSRKLPSFNRLGMVRAIG